MKNLRFREALREAMIEEMERDESVFLIGNREIAAGTDLPVYSEQSPLGSAILGLKVGDKTEYTAPNGRQIAVEVTKVETYTGQ